jgi:two-component system phosphate regulon sensor histidine kinase PhoR
LSHEIRTPLTAILAHVEVLRLTELPPLVQQNSVNLIYQATSRVSHLVQNLLELSRLETSSDDEHILVDMMLVAEEGISELILKAEGEHIQISLDASPPLPRVLGNPNWLKQVFLNVIDNAIKYSRPGDRVNVRLEACPEGLSVTIQDTGPGILPEHLPYVAQRLYRGNTDIPGSGIGLAMVEEILRHHRSRLEITSQSTAEQTGTNVHFILPTPETG